MDTVSLVVTMEMESTFVFQMIRSTHVYGLNMIDLDVITIFEYESTPFTFAVLFLKQSCQTIFGHWVVL